MTDLICCEFEKANYESADRLLWKHKIYMDFWFVYMIDGNYELEEVQNQIYERLSELRKKEPEMEKNTSLLILNKVEKDGKNRERIIADENDVYVFKKYVIQYTQEEWESIRTTIEEGAPLGDFLMKDEHFASLKENPNGPLSLLYNIAHKLPFVTMNVTKKDYGISDEVHVPERIRSVLMWVDEIPKWERKSPTDDEIDVVKRAIEKMITEELDTDDENTRNTPA